MAFQRLARCSLRANFSFRTCIQQLTAQRVLKSPDTALFPCALTHIGLLNLGLSLKSLLHLFQIFTFGFGE